MKQRIKNFLIAVLLLLQLLVVSVLLFFYSNWCRNVIHPDFCSGDPTEPVLYMAYYPEMIYIKPGETQRIKLNIDPFVDGVLPSPEKLFYFGTHQLKAEHKGEYTIYVWEEANDQVIVSWDGIPFNSDNAYLTISATKDAKQPAPYSSAAVSNYAYMAAVDAKLPSAVGISMSIQVKEE